MTTSRIRRFRINAYIVTLTAFFTAFSVSAAAHDQSKNQNNHRINQNYSHSSFFPYPSASPAIDSANTPEEWYAQGEQTVRRIKHNARLANFKINAKAKNIILFLGDGMGISTLTAARIYEGQLEGNSGEEHELFFEKFPNVALSKTYNTNQQTADSAGTMSAIMTGVKTKAGVISVNQNTIRGNCNSQLDNEVTSALELAEIAGMSTGVVSTARITHATPAATYAHIMDRDFEDDRDGVRFANSENCVDIARQLIEFPARFQNEFPWVDGLEVAMGGGRRSFIERVAGADPETGGQGERLDGRDLTSEWLTNYDNSAYVWNQSDFDAIDTNEVDHLLGLFAPSHMHYEADRASDVSGEPSLSEMTDKAIRVLKKNNKGFFLTVEAGRIDHAHHATNPYRALTDAVEFANAVKTAYEMTDPRETLIIVTADHSHVFTIAGYPTRGNPILGKVMGNDGSGEPQSGESLDTYGLPYTTLGYMNGSGFAVLPTGGDAIFGSGAVAGRFDLTGVDTTDQGFHSETLVQTGLLGPPYIGFETHGGEDVAVFATGPGAPMINGLIEQNVIFHVMKEAGRLTHRRTRRRPPHRR